MIFKNHGISRMNLAKGCYGLGLLAMALLLTGCGAALDAAGSGGDGKKNNAADINKTTPEKPGTLLGVAKDGFVQRGTVNVYAWTGSKGKLLGSGTTDDKGGYSIPLQIRSQAVLLEVVSGTYREEATQSNVTFGNQDALYALQNYVAGSRLTTAITYYTTLATGLAENLVRLGMEPAAAVEIANSRVGNIFNVDIRNVMPADVSAPDSVADAQLQYGFATAALSSLTERASVMNGAEPHAAAFTSIKFIQAAYDDVRADGVLDGKGLGGDIVFGKIRLTSEIYRRELALHVLRIANNKSANRTGLGPAQVFDLARKLNGSTDPMFGTDPVIPLDRDKPNVSALVAREFPNLANGSVVFGSLNLSAMVATFPGAAKSELILDGQSTAAATDPENPALLLDTLNPKLAEGRHTLQLRVTDLSGAVGESPQLEVTVGNQQAAIANIDIEGKFVGKDTLVTANVSDAAGIAKVVYSVKPTGSNTFVTVATPQIMTGATMLPAQATFNPRQSMLPAGDAIFRVEATNSVGVTFSKEVPFVIDLDGPRVSIPSAIALDMTNPQGAFFNGNQPCTPVQPVADTDPCILYARSSFNVVANAIDDRAVDSVTLQVDGVTIGAPDRPATITATDMPSFTVDPTNFVAMDGTKEGPRTIAVTALDKAGNMSNTATRRVVFDTTLPEVLSLTVTPTPGRGVLMPFGNRMVARGLLDIAAEVRDPNGLAAAQLVLDLSFLSDLVPQPNTASVVNQGQDTVRLSVTGLDTGRFTPDAPHGFGLNALDRAGNQRFADSRFPDSRTFFLDFDNTAPAIELDNAIVSTLGGAGGCAVSGTVREMHGPATIQRNATVGFRATRDSGAPFEIQTLFQADNGTAANQLPVQIDQNGRFTLIIFLDGGTAQMPKEPRTFQIVLALTAQDALGNSATTTTIFNAMIDRRANTISCTL